MTSWGGRDTCRKVGAGKGARAPWEPGPGGKASGRNGKERGGGPESFLCPCLLTYEHENVVTTHSCEVHHPNLRSSASAASRARAAP